MTPLEKSFQEFEKSLKVIGGIQWRIEEQPNIRGGLWTSSIVGNVADIRIVISFRSQAREKGKFAFRFNISKEIIPFLHGETETESVQAACLEAVRLLKEKVDNWSKIFKTLEV